LLINLRDGDALSLSAIAIGLDSFSKKNWHSPAFSEVVSWCWWPKTADVTERKVFGLCLSILLII